MHDTDEEYVLEYTQIICISMSLNNFSIKKTLIETVIVHTAHEFYVTGS